MFRILLWTILSLTLLAIGVSAGLDPSYSPDAVVDTVPFYADRSYDSGVPQPNDFLKHQIGQWPLRYHELVDYLEAVAPSSGRVKIETHGSSYEGRALYNVFISSEENIRNLETFREGMDRVAAGSAVPAAQLDSLVKVLPAFAWLGYSIHGDEISGTDAAVQLIYQLAAGQDPATLEILDNVVIIIDPTENPDGRERYLSMLQTYKSKVPNYNRFSMQHSGVWPWGRTNHYLFDLNRDWILVRQQETVGRLTTQVKWHPQMVVDAHEMGSNATYLFSPPRQPINYNIPPHYLKWARVFSDDQAAAFDSRGWSYYTGEWNDQWYPGYGSAWSSYFGAIGILYEMAGVDGEFVKQQDDYLLTYHEAVNKQFTSSLANLKTLSDNREDIVRDYHQTRKNITAEGRRSKLQFLFKPIDDEVKMKRFIEGLVTQGIDVTRSTGNFTVGAVVDPEGSTHSSMQFPAGTYIVSTAQPHGALAKAVLEFDPRLKLEFLKEERREMEKFGDTRMYEISSWSLPLAYNLDAYYTNSSFSANSEPVHEVLLRGGQIHNPEAQFAFVIDMVGEKTYRMLVKLFEKDLVVRCSEKPFVIEGQDFGAGSLVLRVRGNRPELSSALEELASEIGLDVYGVSTGNSSEGSLLGAPTFRLLRKPRVAILSGNGVNYNSFGQLWYVLDQELAMPHSILQLTELAEHALDQYNVIIAPSSWGPFFPRLGEGGKKKLEAWVSGGGTLICTGEASVWAADTANGISQVRIKRQVLDKLDAYKLGVERERQAESPEIDTMALWYPEKVLEEEPEEGGKKLGLEKAREQDEWQRKFRPAGVFLRVDLDTEDWLAFGIEPTMPVMVWTRYAFMAKSPVKTVGRLAEANDLRLSGLLWPEARQRWAETAYVTRERKGRGQIVLFAVDPNIRAYNYGSRQLFLNALLLGPGMGSRFEGPYEQER
ncbi:MAG: hypothetical protein GY867_03795 [bacterium]|nr:hypothetical protein [bacterium]